MYMLHVTVYVEVCACGCLTYLLLSFLMFSLQGDIYMSFPIILLNMYRKNASSNYY